MNLSELNQYKRAFNAEGLTEEQIFSKIAFQLKPTFKTNDENRNSYQNLIYYFTDDKRFDGDLDKGLLLIGGYRSGKSLAMEICQLFSATKGRYILNFDTVDVNALFQKHGYDFLSIVDPATEVYLDDLGADYGRVNSFGTIDDPITILLYKREKRFGKDGTKTHASSNLDVKLLQERFPDKIFERILEMFNIISFDVNPNKRK